MVCREYQLSSAVIAQVRTSAWLDDAQIQSLYHTLLHDPLLFGGNAGQWSREALLDRVITNARNDARWNPIYRSQRRAGLANRIESGLAPAAETMPLPRLSALARLNAAVVASQEQLRGRIRAVAGQRGMSEREAVAEFTELRAQAPTGRQARATAGELQDLGLIPADPATRYALSQMAAREPVRTPMREVNQWVPVPPSPGVGNPIVEVGVSDVSDRVELRHADGSVTVHEGVPEDVVDRFVATSATSPTPDAAASLASYPISPQGEHTGWRSRCDLCGRFVGARAHTCITLNSPMPAETRFSVDEQGTLWMPDPPAVQSLVQLHRDVPVRMEVRLLDNLGASTVAGLVQVRPGGTAITDGTRQHLDVDNSPGAADTLRCASCGSVDCAHTQQARELVRRQLRSQGVMPTTEASHDANHAHLLTIGERPSAVPAPTPRPVATISFVEDPEAFRAAAREGANDGVNFVEGPTLRGYAAEATFGIELEYSGHSGNVPSGLVQAGIIHTSGMRGYHHAQRQGWGDWSLEHDGSVSGELVTPVLGDTTADWQQLATACEAIRSHGGETHYAGSHTNIGTPGFTPEHAWRLAHLVRAHEEDLFRLGRTRQSRRSSGYNAPLPPISSIPWTSAYDSNIERQAMVNLRNSMSAGAGQRIEFRFPDASHDPGAIQAQVRLCAAMVGYVRSNDVPVGQHRPHGAAVVSGIARNLMVRPGEEFATQTRAVRGLLDDLFDNDEDRLQVARLWGRGSYYRS